MRLLFAFVVFGFAAWAWPDGITDRPFSSLTLKMVGAFLSAAFLYWWALLCVLDSLKKDRIWPWRWTWAYLAELGIRSALLAAIFWVGFAMNGTLANRPGDVLLFWVLWGCVLVGALWAMFVDLNQLWNEIKHGQSASPPQAAPAAEQKPSWPHPDP